MGAEILLAELSRRARPAYDTSGMKRFMILAAFGSLILWTAVHEGWGRNNPTPGDEHTFETSRRGFEPISYPGPLTREDMVRLLLRRRGDFHLPLTVNYREWRLAKQPDLWELELPDVVKVRVGPQGPQIVSQPDDLRLGVDEILNLPLLVKRESAEPVDLKVITSIGDEGGPTDRFTLEDELTFASLNLRPTSTGERTVSLRFFVGMNLSDAGSPPESTRQAAASFSAEVVEWGWLDLATVENGEPAAARVSLHGSDGLGYAPGEGTLSRITWTAGDYSYYSQGRHRIRIPVGRAELEVVRGLEYKPIRREVEIRANETTELTVALERYVDMGAAGWWSGDVHIHTNYNDHEFLTPEDVRTQALGEDLNVAHLMVANSSGAQIHDEQYFEGRPHRLSGPRSVLYWSEEMRNSGLYGHMCLSGIRELVKPLYTGFGDTPYSDHYPPNHAQALGAQRVGGVASYAHPGYRFTDNPQTMSARELPVDLALGSVEAMDVMSNSNELAATPYWYRLLNSGLECAISAGSDSFTNRRHHWIPGGHRVYVQTEGALDYREWVAGYRAGRSFATNGPLIRFTVNGEGPGARLDLKAGDRLRVQAEAESAVPMERLEIVVNGEVVASSVPGEPAVQLEINEEIVLDGPVWIAARASGAFDRLLVNDSSLYAHTSPVYCYVDGKRYANPADGVFFTGWVDQLIEAVEGRGRFATEEHRREVVALFRQARDYYQKVAASGGALPVER